MIDIKSLLKEKPFSDRLKIASGKGARFFDGDLFTVVCDEKSRALAMKIKAQAENAQKIVELSPRFISDKNFTFTGEKNVLIIGDKDLVKKVRLTCKNGDNRLIALLFDLSIAECFKNGITAFNKEGAEDIELCRLYEIYFDPDLSYRSSRAYFAEAFCECAAAAALLAERRLFGILGEKGESGVDLIEGAIDFLRGARADNLFSSIVSAQLCLAKFYSLSEIIKSDLFSVAGILGKLDSTVGFGEALFASAKAIVSAYKILIGNDLKNADVYPRYDKRLQSINELFGASPSAYFRDFAPYPESVCLKAIATLSRDPRAIKAVDDALNDIAVFDKIYYLTYNGKKRRADYSEKAMRFCLTRGAYLSDGILKYYNDFGILEPLAD